MSSRRSLIQLWRKEFSNYNGATFQQDLLAGITVGAVSLPLALAFGASSGATPAAGLVTAIVAGIVIGALSGAAYQISGPTGAMGAVLMVLAQKYGMEGVWMAGLMSGLLLLGIGLLRLGRFIAFIPQPVITGFTTGIALIIAIGQIDSFLGISTKAAESTALKFLGYFKEPFAPNWYAVILGALVILTMSFWPKKWNSRFPASLLGLILATTLTMVFKWPVKTIESIPQTLFLDARLSLANIPWANLQDFVFPALTITALGAVESLLCGSVASNMTGVRLQANQELIAQGIGNMLIPFFGGVPATAAIARTSVGIKSGGKTRLVSIIHALVLLASMFLLAPVMSHIPLAALAGVLIVTAWRMNEWEEIHYIFTHQFKTAIVTFILTMLATITLDLTQAIVIGAFLSGAIFLNQASDIDIDIQQINPDKLRQRGIEVNHLCANMRVAYLTGPLFFAATNNFYEAFRKLDDTKVLILSMRGVPIIDTSGLQAIAELHARLQKVDGTLMLSGLHANVQRMLERGGLLESIGVENIFWGADQAIIAAMRKQPLS